MVLWEEVGDGTRAVRAEVTRRFGQERRALRAMASLMSGYLLVGVLAAAMVAGRPDPAMVLAMAPAALAVALVVAPVALGLLVAPGTRRFASPALVALGASVAAATTALGAIVVASMS